MSTLFATVAGPREADEVVRQLISTGLPPTEISVVGVQGVPLSLGAEEAQTRRGIVRGLLRYGLLGGIVGLLCGLLTLHIPGLGNMAVVPGAQAGPPTTMAIMFVAGLGFGAIVGFLANAVAGEESTAPYAENLAPGELAVVVDEHRANASARTLLQTIRRSHAVEQLPA